jgi:1-acyl-sn-glycerol-3-phosphate acyltransferase
MTKIISYPISTLYYLVFGALLVIFHPIQWLCLNIGGYLPHKKSVDWLNGALLLSMRILGTSIRVRGQEHLPKNGPVIIVSNHQSLYDIILIIWYLRSLHPKFVSKIELAKGIPSVSFNLRHGGSVVIDRKDPRQALTEIRKLGEYITVNQRSAVIFPEGTRSRTGNLKPFAENGLKMLYKATKDAKVVPVTVNQAWKIVKWGSFPLGLGVKLELIIHPYFEASLSEFETQLIEIQETIKAPLTK